MTEHLRERDVERMLSTPPPPRNHGRVTVERGRKWTRVDADYYPGFVGDERALACRIAVHAARRVITSGRKTRFWFGAASNLVDLPANDRGLAFLDHVERRMLDEIAQEQDRPSCVVSVLCPNEDAPLVSEALRDLGERGQVQTGQRYLADQPMTTPRKEPHA